MARSRRSLTLGARLEQRRSEQLGISQREAARRVGVSRTTWRAWENDEREPEDYNHARIEEFCAWEAGSVAAVRDDRPPRPLRAELATVTTLPSVAHSQPDDDVVSELRKMGLPRDYVESLIERYWEEKRYADSQRSDFYLTIARRKQANG